MGDPTNRVEPNEAAAKTATRDRLPWHAPQFIQTEVAQTDMQGGGETDPTGFPS